MAIIVPNLRLGHTKVTPGERRFALRLEQLLEDDYWCFYDIPVGKRRRYPDFIILHPRRGLLFLEVKDWKLTSIRNIDHYRVRLQTTSGLKMQANPVEQARQGAYQAINMLKGDPDLQQKQGPHKGNLICPYGYGVVLTNITRKQIEAALPDEVSDRVLPGHLLICQDEMLETTDPEAFQERLWGMFNYRFDRLLTLPEVDRIRWHLYPEIRIDNLELFAQDEPNSVSVPDIVKVMDIEQEQLARGLGEGHRVIHGVAGSGKTLILGYRSEVLSEVLAKPILVLCFNITLAAKLRAHMTSRGITDKVHVYHFHDWCGQQLKTFHVDVVEGDKHYWERQVDSVINGVEKEWIPREQYGAVLIDEGHDFEEDWLRLVVQMIDRNTNSLLLLYDDAQAIYRRSGLGFSLSSVGVQARGRTKILKLNYRNTREILTFAYEFAKEYLKEKISDNDDHVPLVKPETAGVSGPKPIFRQLQSFQEEIRFVANCVRKWHDDGVPWRDIAVIYPEHWMGREVAQEYGEQGIPFQLLATSESRKQYDPQSDQVAVLTRQSSKGLEFPRVILVGLGKLRTETENLAKESRLLYVAMTRARECLLVTASEANVYTRKIESIANCELN